MLEMFMNKNPEPARKLGEILMEKLTEKKTEIESQFSEAGVIIHNVDPRVEAMYEGVRDVLKRYRSGKLPKAFKLIPRLANWEQILYITGKNLNSELSDAKWYLKLIQPNPIVIPNE